MKAINLENMRTNNGISVYEIVKSLANEDNFTDEDWEYEIPARKKPAFYWQRYYQEYSK